MASPLKVAMIKCKPGEVKVVEKLPVAELVPTVSGTGLTFVLALPLDGVNKAPVEASYKVTVSEEPIVAVLDWGGRTVMESVVAWPSVTGRDACTKTRAEETVEPTDCEIDWELLVL